MTAELPNLVVGGGPVGLTAAVEMRRRGLPVRLVDAKSAPSPESRALAIHAPTLELFEPSGFTDTLLQHGHKVKHVVVHSQGDVLLRLPLADIPHPRYRFILVLAQSQTESLLARHLQSFNTELENNCRLTGFTDTGDRVEATLTRNGRTETLQARTLIGADGAHSMVRKSLGLDFDGERQPEQFALADIVLRDWPWPFDTAVLEFTPEGPSGFIPVGEGHGRLVRPDTPAIDQPPWRANIVETGWATTFNVSYRQVERYRKGNVYLAGDAAHIHSPAGGLGMNLGMADAATLARLLARGDARDYTGLRHAAGETVLKRTRANTTGLLQNVGLICALVRFAVRPALAFAPLRRHALARLAGLDLPMTFKVD